MNSGGKLKRILTAAALVFAVAASPSVYGQEEIDAPPAQSGDDETDEAGQGKPVYGPGSTGAAKGPGGDSEAPGEPAEKKKKKQAIGCFGAGNYSSLIFLVLMFAVFYFLLIRPQQKKQKEHQSMLSNLKVGDRVLTTGGILGKITGFSDHYAVVEIQEKVRIKVLRSSLSGKAGGPDKQGN